MRSQAENLYANALELIRAIEEPRHLHLLTRAIQEQHDRAGPVFRVGDHVRWEARGSVWEGTAVKINPKTIRIEVTTRDGVKQQISQTWRVSPVYLTRVGDNESL